MSHKLRTHTHAKARARAHGVCTNWSQPVDNCGGDEERTTRGSSVQCLTPYRLKNQDIHVPCGRCRPCRINRAQEWADRMIHEASQHEHNAFITLTYDDDFLQEEITKREAQLFLKRLRQHIAKPIRYFLAGEYGEETGRAHYHAAIFNFETCGKCRVCTKLYRLRGKTPEEGTDCYALEQAWPYGRIDAGTVEPASARYIADYLQKDTRPETYGHRQPPFSLKSQGLGRAWAAKNVTTVTAATGLPKGTTRTPVPRYYIAKLLEQSESPEMDDFVIRANRTRTALKQDDKRTTFWEERNRSALHNKFQADIQADREKAARERSKEAKL